MVGGDSTSATTELDAMESTDVGEGVAVVAPGHRQPGQTIGPYEVQCTIGAGAMGVVYAAVEPGTRRRLAVKLMHPRGAYTGGPVGSHRADAWLRNEARVLSRLSHPNVVRVYGVGSDHGRPYMAMELVEGERSPPGSRSETTAGRRRCTCAWRPRAESRPRIGLESSTAISSPTT